MRRSAIAVSTATGCAASVTATAVSVARGATCCTTAPATLCGSRPERGSGSSAISLLATCAPSTSRAGMPVPRMPVFYRKSTRLHSTLSLHSALPIYIVRQPTRTGQRVLSYFASGNVRAIDESGVHASSAHARFRYDAFGAVQELDLQGNGTTDTRHDRRYGELIERRDQVAGTTTTSFISRKIPGPGGIVASRRGSGNDWVFQFGEPRGNRFFTTANGAFVQDELKDPVVA